MHIRDFQAMMRRIYFDKDSRRGAAGMHSRLMEELGELRAAMKEHDLKNMENEFADVLAWLASLANVVNIDLEKATKTKYRDRCPKCVKSPCQCPFSYKNQLRQEPSKRSPSPKALRRL